MILSNKSAIVTGGARGLGRAYARRLIQLGAKVVTLDLDPNAAATYGEIAEDAITQALDQQIVTIQADLTRRNDVDSAVAQAIAQMGGVDILINNAGGAITSADRSAPSMMNDEDLTLILQANLLSTVYCCQAVIPRMKEQQSGVIINTSSVAGRLVLPAGNLAHYGIAKAAVTHFTRNLASELGPHGIRVNCIAPGTILTGRIKALSVARGIGTAAEAEQIPLRRLGTPEDCAGVIEFLVSDLSAYVTGQCISVCGGAALTPA